MACAGRRAVPRAGRGRLLGLYRRQAPYFIYGSYPPDQRWRVDVAFALAAVLIVWLLWPRAPRKGIAASCFFVVCRSSASRCCIGAPSLGLPRVEPICGAALWCACSSPSSASSSRCRAASCSRWAPVDVAGAQHRQRGADRIRARRAVDRRAVHGQHHAAAVPAADWSPDRLAAPADRHRPVRLGLYGGSGARRAEGRCRAGQTRRAQALGLGRVAHLSASWSCRRRCGM